MTLYQPHHTAGSLPLETGMFDSWLKSSPSAFWTDLISDLKTMNEHRVASDIAARYSAGLTPGNDLYNTLCMHKVFDFSSQM